jgi:hypothetical protein
LGWYKENQPRGEISQERKAIYEYKLWNFLQCHHINLKMIDCAKKAKFFDYDDYD